MCVSIVGSKFASQKEVVKQYDCSCVLLWPVIAQDDSQDDRSGGGGELDL